MKKRRSRKLRAVSAATAAPAAHKPHFLDDAHELDIQTDSGQAADATDVPAGSKSADAEPAKPAGKPPRKIQL